MIKNCFEDVQFKKRSELLQLCVVGDHVIFPWPQIKGGFPFSVGDAVTLRHNR